MIFPTSLLKASSSSSRTTQRWTEARTSAVDMIYDILRGKSVSAAINHARFYLTRDFKNFAHCPLAGPHLRAVLR